MWDLGVQTRSKTRVTRLVNIYDQWIEEPTDEGTSRTRPIRQVSWPTVITNRTIVLGDFNAISRLWSVYGTEANQRDLEELIDSFNLVIANTAEPTRVLHNQKSTIDLTLHTPDIVLEEWFIDKETATPSDHELIVFSWLDFDAHPTKSHRQQTGWNIESLLQNPEKPREYWLQNRPQALRLDTTEMVDLEANRFQTLVHQLLTKFAKPSYQCTRSKKWWSPEIRAKRTEFNSTRRKYQHHRVTPEKYKEVRNSYYSHKKVPMSNVQQFPREN